MSEVKAKGQAHQQELNDLQAQYSKRKKELVESKESELRNMREHLEGQYEKVKSHGEAAVNHIRKDTNEQLYATQQQQQQKIQRVRDTNERELEAIKKYGEEGQRAQQRNIQTKRDHTEQILKDLEGKEEIKRRNIVDASHKLQQDQNNSLHQVELKGRLKTQEVYRKGQQEQQKLIEQHQQQQAKMNEKFNKQISEVQNNREELVTQQKIENRQNFESLQNRNQTQLKKEQMAGDRKLDAVQKKYRDMKVREQQQGTERVERVKQNVDQKVDFQTRRGQERVEKIQQEYEQQFADTKALGNRRIEDEKHKSKVTVDRIQKETQKELVHLRSNLDRQKQELSGAYEKQAEHNSEIYKKNLANQKDRFNNRYLHGEKTNREALTIQQGVYDKALNLKRKDMVEKLGFYTERQEDPFYRIEDRGTKLRETSEHYVLKTYIPEHEKQNVKVKVQQDRVFVQGSRAFNDKIQDEKKDIKTNNYQTFSEEFKFDNPVATFGIKEERDGDHVTYTIPKLAFAGKKPVGPV